MIYKINKLKDANWQTEAENLEGDTPIYPEEEINDNIYAIDILNKIKSDLKPYKIDLDFDDWNILEDNIVVNCYFYAPKELSEEELKKILTNIVKSYKGDWDDLKLEGEIDDQDNLYLIDLYIYTKYFDK